MVRRSVEAPGSRLDSFECFEGSFFVLLGRRWHEADEKLLTGVMSRRSHPQSQVLVIRRLSLFMSVVAEMALPTDLRLGAESKVRMARWIENRTRRTSSS